MCSLGTPSLDAQPVDGWPEGVRDVRYRSAADNTEQPTLLYIPEEGPAPAPLLVALHTWSNGYKQPEPHYARWCIEHGWAMVHPHFRGPNRRPEACGSELAVQDILSVVEFARSIADIDADRIYLTGGSGGGHMSLLMAGRAPTLWAAVSAWCPICDLAAWHRETSRRGLRYREMIEASCGGPPGASTETDEQYRRRSPSAFLHRARGIAVDINTGIHDGHRGSVPVSHALEAWNSLAKPEDRFAAADVAAMVDGDAVPPRLAAPVDDLLYFENPVLLRRVSGRARITVFEGGHQMLAEAALTWLARQRRGQQPVWNLSEPVGNGGAATDVGH